MDNASEAKACDSLLEESPLFVILRYGTGAPLGLENTPKTAIVFLSWESAKNYLARHVRHEIRDDYDVAGRYDSLADLKECLGKRVKGYQFYLVDEAGTILKRTD